MTDSSSVNSEEENRTPKNVLPKNEQKVAYGGDSHSIQITSFRLNGSNYFRWSQSVQMYIRGKGKMGYLTGDRKEPDASDPQHDVWDAENSMVMTWLVNSMEEEISSNYMCYSTAKELWESVKEMYSDLENKSQIYELTLKATEIRQGNENVTKYFHSLKRIWQELDLFNTYKWNSTDDEKHHQQTVEEGRIFQFLAGLNEELDEVRGRIIGRSTLPSLGEMFSEVRREETRRSVMMGKAKSDPYPPETNALIADTAALKSSSNQRNTSNVVCDYCNRPRHTRETCWKLHGKPAHLKNGKPGPRSVPAAHEAKKSLPNQDQVEELIRLLKSSSLSGIPNASLAQTGNFSTPTSLSCTSNMPAPWIIDSGASDHMTGLSSLFQTYSPCPGNKKIKIADGSFSPIAGEGKIPLSTHIDLKNVLHVPKLSYNLLSVSKICEDSNCYVKFFNTHCIFQDRNSGKMIGSAKMMDGLYYFEGVFENKVAHGLSGISSASVRDQIMLWHNRLGHPNFQYLRHLFPDLFKNVNCSSFECESCVLSKSHKTPYSSRPYHASKPFYLIHSDVWGPSKITTQFGKRWFVTFIDDHTRLCWVYLMKDKSEVPEIFKCFSKMIETQFDAKISILRSDNGTEYFNKNLGEFFQHKGIQHQSTCPNTPQQNGIAERKNRHLLEVARAIMFESNVPKFLWGDAVLTASYLINRMPTRVLSYRTPLDVFKTFFSSMSIAYRLTFKSVWMYCFYVCP
jgi:transposase InsO family protein